MGIILPIIFQSDFEDPISPFGWDGVSTGAGRGGIVAVNNDRPYHGLSNLFCTYPATATPNSHACVYKACGIVPYHDHFFARAMNCMIDRGPPPIVTHAYPHHMIFGFYELPSPGSLVCSFGIWNDAGTLKWMIYYRHAGAFYQTLGGPVALNTPYTLECEILQSTEGNADGAARLWVNGQLALEAIGLDNDDRDINYATFGFSNTGNNLDGDQHFWGDCYALSTEYIGPALVCEDFTTQVECEAAGCYWWDNACHSSPPPVVCQSHTTQAECEAAGCYWYNGACHSEPLPPVLPPTPLFPRVRETLSSIPLIASFYAKIDEWRAKS